RPLFPKELKKDVQVVITVLSVDGENKPDILAAITTSAALAISKIPWRGPIGTTRIGLVNRKEEGKEEQDEFVVNPTTPEDPFLELDLIVSSRNKKALMIEAGGRQVRDDLVEQGVIMANEWNQKIVAMIEEWAEEIGDKKIEVAKDEKIEEAKIIVEKSYKDKIEKLVEDGVTREVGAELKEIIDDIAETEKETFDDKGKIAEAVDYIFKKTIREMILTKGKRPDGRKVDQIRPISAEVGVLPRTHGSAIFTRGETQTLTVATLGPSSMEQIIEGPEGEETKRYMHHYSFPPYSVGETGRIGSPNRREIGHGALAERALEAVVPDASVFPYAIRVVSEIMSSNGSTSQAAVCGSTLSLMDAGVPLLAPVAGIAIGLMSKGDDYMLLTDIIGLEDFGGDMDFKVAGTDKGITAIQLDVKIDGLTEQQVSETLVRAREARLQVLEKMMAVIPSARNDVSKYAPKIKTVKINPEKIGEVIGSGGKTIRNISATTGATVDVAEDGTVSISAVDEDAVNRAAEWVDLITRELKKGEVFEGTVKRIVNFGAFVEIVPGKEGLVHVSEMSSDYVQSPEDVVEIGQRVKVNVKEVDEHGRINLSMLFGERPAREDRPQREDRGDRSGGIQVEDRPYEARGGDRPQRSSGGSRDFGGRRDDRRGSGGRSSGGRSFGGRGGGGRGPRRAPFDSMRPNGDDRNRR
ncbi:MAG TPA: polyribonucleotide nucleotidyltransferase, partial [Patescibacteria group bacterium]|nr:polyribonucleotide nucleotidyltransferase [Patescibacteria group bacterium]